MQQLSFDDYEATVARDVGMKQAVDHANEAVSGWSDEAYRWLHRYAKTHKQFISEHATAWAAEQGFVSDTISKKRAWGQVFRRGAKEGIIVRVGHGTSLRRHRSPCPLWESAI